MLSHLGHLLHTEEWGGAVFSESEKGSHSVYAGHLYNRPRKNVLKGKKMMFLLA